MEYPVYYLQLEEGQMKYGLQDIALVDDPAIKSMFVKFSNDEHLFKFTVQNDEQRIITGAVMIPDKLIYREENNKPFYVVATKDTIFDAAQKWGKENRNNNIKLTHDAKDTTPDVFMFESFVTDENRVSSVKGFESLPLGTWFITCKVLSDQVWNDIKSGVFNGFSLEALFKMQPAAMLNDQEIQALTRIVE
jgi:hypothetical protein